MFVSDIEIHRIPERKGFRAEIQTGDPVTRTEVWSPLSGDHAADLDALFARISEWVEERMPRPKLEVVRQSVAVHEVPPEPDTDLDALRAAAEAAGVDVDKRWGEARLRREIARAGTREDV